MEFREAKSTEKLLSTCNWENLEVDLKLLQTGFPPEPKGKKNDCYFSQIFLRANWEVSPLREVTYNSKAQSLSVCSVPH